MDYLNIKRGRESDEHRRMKEEVRALLFDSGYLAVFPELKCCDLVAVRFVDGIVSSLAVELERSSRSVVSSARRNFKNGCDSTLIVASSETVYDSCVRTLRKRLSVDLVEKTFINTFEQLRDVRQAFILSEAPLYSDIIRQRKTLYSPLFAEVKLYSLPLDSRRISKEMKSKQRKRRK